MSTTRVKDKERGCFEMVRVSDGRVLDRIRKSDFHP